MISIIKPIIIIILIILLIYLSNNYEGFEPEQNRKILPKNIFAYWHESNIKNKFIKRNYEILKKQFSNSQYNFIMYNKNTIDKEIGNDYEFKGEIIHQHYADFVRLYLLKKYGGIWLDASIIIIDLEFINKIYEIFKTYPFDIFLFEYTPYTEKSPEDMENKYLENWFLIAPKNSLFINDMYDEYTKALKIGFIEYKQQLKAQNVNFDRIFNDDPENVYLMQHAIIRYLIQKNKNKYKIAYQQASDNMFKIHEDNKWNSNKIFDDILNGNKLKNGEISGIKFIGKQRRYYESNNMSDKLFDAIEKCIILS